MVRAAQKGELKNPSKEIADAARSMTSKQVKDFAKTEHSGLPEHVSKEASISDRLLKLKTRRGELGKPETVKRTLKKNPQPKPDFDNHYFTQKKAEAAFVRGFVKAASIFPQPPDALGLATGSSNYDNMFRRSIADTLSSGLLGAGVGGLGGAGLGYLSGRKEGKGGRRALLGGLLGAGIGGLGGAGYTANEGVKDITSKYVSDAGSDISRMQKELGPSTISMFGKEIPLGFARGAIADFEGKISPDQMSEYRYNVEQLREQIERLTRESEVLKDSNLLNILPRLAATGKTQSR